MAQDALGTDAMPTLANAWATTPSMVDQALSMPRERAEGPPLACASSAPAEPDARARRTRVPVPPPSTPMR